MVYGPIVSFKYDPFGRRIYKSSSSATSVYAYDGDNLVEETNSSSAVVARYEDTQNIDEPLGMLRSGATSFYNADGLGSITSLANSSGSLAQTYSFDSFGNQTASSGSLTNPFRYTAREFDSETSLYYYRARYYGQSAGRFLNEDPSQFSADVNFYAYVQNSPIGLSDPFGLCPPQIDYCKYRGKAPSPADFAAKGKAFKSGIDTMLKFSPDPESVYAYAIGALVGDFAKGGPLDAQPSATGTALQRASYGNYAYGAFFAGAGLSLSDALSAANAYGFKQQLFGGAYKGRTMDPTYTHLPAVNVQDIINGYMDEIQGKLCEK